MCNDCHKLYPRPVQAIGPEPSESVRRAIVAALAEAADGDAQPRGWAAVALAEAVETGPDE